jgi:hypothetical protein
MKLTFSRQAIQHFQHYQQQQAMAATNCPYEKVTKSLLPSHQKSLKVPKSP